MEDYSIRSATVDDAAVLREIYSYYVKNTAVTFEVEPPTSDEIARRIESYTKKHPYLVIEDEDYILGFAFAHAFRERPAYDYAAEVSIYLRHDARHTGYGRAIYTALEKELGHMGVCSLYACIATADSEDEFLSADSPRFHAALGYRQCGEFRHCGRKFDRWYNMIWMEKILRDSPDHPAPITPYPEIIRNTPASIDLPLSSYDNKEIRLVTKYGDLFYGEAMYFPDEYGMHEFGREEEGIQIGAYISYVSEIKSIEKVD